MPRQSQRILCIYISKGDPPTSYHWCVHEKEFKKGLWRLRGRTATQLFQTVFCSLFKLGGQCLPAVQVFSVVHLTFMGLLKTAEWQGAPPHCSAVLVDFAGNRKQDLKGLQVLLISFHHFFSSVDGWQWQHGSLLVSLFTPEFLHISYFNHYLRFMWNYQEKSMLN